MKKYTSILIVLVLFACGSKKKAGEEAFLEGLDSTKIAQPAISDEVMTDVMQQIPSPLEISMVLKESGTSYNRGILNSTDNTELYISDYQRALNLGIYGTDLGYTNIYGNTQDGLFYLNSIKTLANGMDIGQFFDFNIISRLAANDENLDSLLLISTQNFNQINHYLQEQKRSNLSTLLLTGGWLEALHISCQVFEHHPDNEELKEKIGEQKIILKNIILLLSVYKDSDQKIQSLVDDLRALEEEYKKVDIIYTYQESTMEEVDGVLMIRDNSTMEIKISQENVDSITKVTDAIRSKIIS